jgi:hypothetical protein
MDNTAATAILRAATVLWTAGEVRCWLLRYKGWNAVYISNHQHDFVRIEIFDSEGKARAQADVWLDDAHRSDGNAPALTNL